MPVRPATHLHCRGQTPQRHWKPAATVVAALGREPWRILSVCIQRAEPPMSDMPDFSNVKGGSSSTATKIHEVKAGDSLSKIAKQEYGDANKWPQIFEAK